MKKGEHVAYVTHAVCGVQASKLRELKIQRHIFQYNCVFVALSVSFCFDSLG